MLTLCDSIHSDEKFYHKKYGAIFYRYILGKSAWSFTTVKHCVAEFKRVCTSCQYELRRGRLNEVTMPEMLNKIRKISGLLNECLLKCTSSRHGRHFKNGSYTVFLRLHLSNFCNHSYKSVWDGYFYNFQIIRFHLNAV